MIADLVIVALSTPHIAWYGLALGGVLFGVAVALARRAS